MARQSLNEQPEGSQSPPAPSTVLANSSVLPVLRQFALQVISAAGFPSGVSQVLFRIFSQVLL